MYVDRAGGWVFWTWFTLKVCNGNVKGDRQGRVTRRRDNEKKMPSVLDHLLISPACVDNLESCRVGEPLVRSDHNTFCAWWKPGPSPRTWTCACLLHHRTRSSSKAPQTWVSAWLLHPDTRARRRLTPKKDSTPTLRPENVRWGGPNMSATYARESSSVKAMWANTDSHPVSKGPVQCGQCGKKFM